jgi:hypothetical protein
MRFVSDAFDYDPKTKAFSAEASELARGTRAELFHYLYRDATDRGITITSRRTGADVDYYVSSMNDDWMENDIYQWTLLPTPESLRGHPGCAGTSVTIYND